MLWRRYRRHAGAKFRLLNEQFIELFDVDLASRMRALEPLLDELKQPIEAVVLLELDDAVLIERLLARGRADDNEAVIRNRLEVYREKTSPLISFYRDKGLLVSVEANGSVEEITERITKVLS